ncbi:MAG: hypothetical protein ACOX9E_11350 [Lentisphaeria bacterium]|jgi:hypothetical protein
MTLFNDMLCDNIIIMKKNGEVIENVKASVQNTRIHIHRADIIIEAGDTISRLMSNGAKEKYVVINPCFHEKFYEIEAHYVLKVRKLGIDAAKESHKNITYNISGEHARINQNTIDNSSNVFLYSKDVSDRIQELRKEIKGLSSNIEKLEDALEHVNEIEAQFRSGSPKQSVVKTLLAALPPVGNIASIGSFLLSAIG